MGAVTDVRAIVARGVAVAGPVIAVVPWQALGRRLGLPYRSPSLRTSLAVVPATLLAALAAAGLVTRLARTVTGHRGTAAATAAAPGAATATATGGPAATPDAALAAVLLAEPFPVLGPYAAAAADAWDAWRRSTARRSRHRAARALAGTAVLVVGRRLMRRALSAALTPGTPRPPEPPAPDLSLNVAPAFRPGVRGPEGVVVYYDGVGRATPRSTPVGREFVEAVHRRLPTWLVVMSLMPNDITQRPAWERPVTGALWRALGHRSRDWLVARGVWEGIVALDGRYRDRLTAAHTSALVTHLLAAGYRPGSGTPIVLVGLSAGAQTALRVASDVARAVGGAPVDVVALGGFFDGRADLSAVRRVHAAVSWGDPAELAPVPFLPSRWTALHVGAWSRARRRRTVTIHRMDYATHVGRTGYLGRAHAPDGRTRLEQSADLVELAARELTRHSSARGTGAPAGGAPR